MSTQSLLYAISKILDMVVLTLLTIFFIRVLAFDIAYFGFHEAIIPIPHEQSNTLNSYLGLSLASC